MAAILLDPLFTLDEGAGIPTAACIVVGQKKNALPPWLENSCKKNGSRQQKKSDRIRRTPKIKESKRKRKEKRRKKPLSSPLFPAPERSIKSRLAFVQRKEVNTIESEKRESFSFSLRVSSSFSVAPALCFSFLLFFSFCP